MTHPTGAARLNRAGRSGTPDHDVAAFRHQTTPSGYTDPGITQRHSATKLHITERHRRAKRSGMTRHRETWRGGKTKHDCAERHSIAWRHSAARHGCPKPSHAATRSETFRREAAHRYHTEHSGTTKLQRGRAAPHPPPNPLAKAPPGRPDQWSRKWTPELD